MVRIAPRRKGEHVRELYASEEVRTLLSGGEKADLAEFPDAVAHALIDTYITGGWIQTSLRGKGSVDIERMHSVDEVWLFCFRKASANQWRIMGRFSKVNTFIGLKIHKRSDLRGKAYERKAHEFIDIWNQCFSGANPLRGNHWSDYLSPPVRDEAEADTF